MKSKVFINCAWPALLLALVGIADLYGQAPAELVLKANSQTSASDWSSLLQGLHATKVKTLPGKAEVWRVPEPVDGALRLLTNDQRVKFAEPYFGRPDELFSLVSTNNLVFTPQQRRILDGLKRKQGDLSIQLTRIQQPKFMAESMQERSEVIALPVGTETSFSLKMLRSVVNKDGTISCEGKSTTPGATALFIMNGDRITGTVQSGNAIYSIKPLGAGLHAVVKENQFPPDHPPGKNPPVRKLPEAPPPKGKDGARFLPQSGNPKADTLLTLSKDSVIRVLVVYTPSVSNAVFDVTSLAQLAILNSNTTFTNSRIHARLELAGMSYVDYAESGDLEVDVERFCNPADHIMDGVHKIRDSVAADIAVLLVDQEKVIYSGWASAIAATADSAFCAVDQYWAVPNYSFVHEIGHLMGARHDLESDSEATPFQDGHGFWVKGEWRCVMTTREVDGCARQPYWSNPDIKYNNRTPMGTTNYQNNARVLNFMAPAVAKFR
jgi:peptidyl-Asp metalloendopeptidase